MTFSLQKFKAYGVRTSGSTRQHVSQVAEFYITGANTDTALDISSDTSGSLGTFWTAAVADATYGTLATTALTAIQNIAAQAISMKSAQSEGLMNRVDVGASDIITLLSSASVGGAAAEAYTVTGLLSTDTVLSVTPVIASATGRSVISALTSAAYGGGSATPTLAVTGLKTTDTILAATQIAKNSNSLPLIAAATTCATNDQYVVAYSADPGTTGTVRVLFSRVATVDTYVPVSYGSPTANTLTVTYGADPGAGAKVNVQVYRNVGTITPAKGQYTIAISGHLPSIVFASADAPTSQHLKITWTIADGLEAVVADLGAPF